MGNIIQPFKYSYLLFIEIIMFIDKMKHFQDNFTRELESQIWAEYQKYLNNTFYLLFTNLDDTGKIKFNLKNPRIILILIIKSSSLLFDLKFVLNLIWPSSFTSQLTCDTFHYLGNDQLLNLSPGLFFSMINIGSTVFQYFQYRAVCYIFGYLCKVKNDRINSKIDRKRKAKFYRTFYLITIIIPMAHIASAICLNLVMDIPLILGYFDPALNFNGFGKYVYTNTCMVCHTIQN